MAQPKYRATKIGDSVIGGMYSFASDGTVGCFTGGGKPSLWRNGETKTVESVIGRPAPTDLFSAPRVRSWNTFSGTSYGGGFGYAVHNGNVTIVEPEGEWSAAVGWINNKGDFVGTRYRQNPWEGDPVQFAYPFGVFGGTYRRILNTGEFESWSALAINNQGEVAGSRSTFSALTPYGSGYRWNQASNTAEHLSTFAGANSIIPRKYLDNGLIFGESTDGAGRAYCWSPDGVQISIRAFNGEAILAGDMNESGTVVGTLMVPRSTGVGLNSKGIVWQNGQSWLLSDITINVDSNMTGADVNWRNPVINDLGQIMVNVEFFEGNVGRSYLYRFDPVPEPATLVALGAGTLALLRRRRRA